MIAKGRWALPAVVAALVWATTGYAAGTKIAYVDLQRCIDESDAGKLAKKDLEDMVKVKQMKIDELGRQIDEMKATVEKQANLLTNEARKAKQEDIDRMIRDYKRLVKDSQEDLQKEESRRTAAVINEIRKVVEKIGADEKYGVIFEKTSSGIIHISEKLDITDHVLEVMNKEKKKAQ